MSSPATSAGRQAPSVFALLMVFALALPPLLVDLGTPDASRVMENIALASSQETWLRQRSFEDIPRESDAWLMPTWNGHARINKPPLLVWLNMLAWSDLTPATSTPDQLAYRARLVSVALALVGIGATFWIGVSLGDRKTGLIAALVLASCWFVQRQARVANYDIQFTAWATLSLAAALHAMRPFGEQRRVSSSLPWWALGGVALAASWLTKGPLALVITLLPLAGVFVLIGERRRHIAGLVVFLLTAAALALPWYAYAALHVDNAAHKWVREYEAQRKEFQTPFYYFGVLILALPWTLWLVGGFVQPFKAAGRDRRRLLVSLVWFALLFVFFSIPGAKQQRYILPIMLAVALLVAQVVRHHEAFRERGEVDATARLLTLPQTLTLLAVSLAFVPFVLLQEWLVERGLLPHAPLAGVPPWVGVAAGLALIALALTVWWLHRRWRPLEAAFATAAWMFLLMTFVWYGECEAHEHVTLRADGAAVRAAVGVHPVWFVRASPGEDRPGEEILFYARRIIREIPPDHLADMVASASARAPLWVMVKDKPAAAGLMREHGFEPVLRFHDDPMSERVLWRFPDPDRLTKDAAP